MFRLRRLFRPRRQQLGPDNAFPTENQSGVRIDVDDLIRLRLHACGLDLRSRRTVAATLGGAHQSRFRGRGMDYLESRQYQPGDDIRNMDWRVMARVGRPHTKLYQEERERPVIVMVDLNPSMHFGTRGAFKTVIAARAAALIGWATVRQGDRIGALLFNGIHREIQPQGGRRGVLRLIRVLASVAQPPTDRSIGIADSGFNEAMRRIRRVVRPGSLVFVLSDFYGLDEDSGGHLARLRQHNDLVACRILDPVEKTVPPPGRYGVTDGKRQAVLDTRARDQRAAYREYFSNQQRKVEDLMRRQSIPLLQLMTTDDVAEELTKGLMNSNRQGTGKSGVAP